jgi:hypothetical protein
MPVTIIKISKHPKMSKALISALRFTKGGNLDLGILVLQVEADTKLMIMEGKITV